MKPKHLILQLLALVLTVGSASAQITVLDTAFAFKSSGTTFTSTDLGGFDPAGADKLVVAVHDEGGGASGGITYAGQALTEIVDQTESGRHAELWFLDYSTTATQGNLVLPGSGSLGISILAVSGTGDGFGALATNSGSASINLDALVDGSLVVAAFTNNGSTATVDPPLTPLLGQSVGSTAGASGWYVTDAGVETYSFTGNSSTRLAAAVAFPALGADGIAPAFATSSPADGATGVVTDLSQITVNFDEGIVAGSAGTFALKKVAGGATVATWDVTQVAFGLTSISVNLDSVLEPATAYYFDISSGLIEDYAGNTTAYANPAWEFTTGALLSKSLESESDSGSYTFTAASQAGFDASSSDKLVVFVSSRRSNGTTTGFTATYAGSAMNLAVEEQNNANGDYYAGIFYLDNPPTTGDLVVTRTGSGNRRGVAVTLLAMSGTLDGAGDTDGQLSSSTSINALLDGAIVTAVSSHGSAQTPQSPLVPTLSALSNANAFAASGYQVVSPAALVTPSFSSSTVTVAASFEPDTGDVTDPTLVSSTPANGASGLNPFNLSLVLNMSENVVAGTGNIEVYRESDDVLVETVDVTSDSVSFTGSSVTVFLGSFASGPDYYVNIASTAIVDAPGNSYAGITNDSTLVFTTAAAPASGVVNVDFTKVIEDEANASTYTFPLADIDPTQSDKLVVHVSSEASALTTVSMTYAGSDLVQVVSKDDGVRFHAGIFYLDNPSARGDLVITHSTSRFGAAVSILALSNTASGFADSAFTLGSSTSLVTSADTSLVFAANIFNGGNGSTPQAPLTEVSNFENGSASHGSGYQLVSTFGTTVTPSFESGLVTVAASFGLAGGGGGPVLTPFETWAGANGLTGGNNGFADNPSGGPFDNGLLWILGSTTPLGYNSYDSLVTATGDGTTGLTFVFNRVDASIGEAGISIGYSTDAFENDINTVGPIPASGTNVDIGDGVLATIVDNGATDTITVVIPASLGNPGGSLYGRLLATEL